ncbi:MAG TPA: glycosyltransferase 87 family protein, partial [Solirubrobacteraceae bacterium]|nr:glycosyltransferase 87 family protein [Solirubrobacteraceae bacterium]
ALLPAMLFFALRLDPRSPQGRERLALALLVAAAAVWLEPVWTTLRYGQVDLLIATLVVWDLSRADDARLQGVGIGLASALKLTPAIFVVYLLLSRRTRAAAVSAATFLASVALAYVALPGDSREYWGGAFAEPDRVGRIENAANQSLRGALARLLHTTAVSGLWLGCAAAVAILGITLALAAARRGDQARGFALCALTGLLVSPVSWSHHWVLAVPALALLALDAHRRRSIALLIACALVAIVAYAHVIWWVPIDHPLHSELHLDALQLLFADAYVLAGLAALAAAAVPRLRATFATMTGCALHQGFAAASRPNLREGSATGAGAHACPRRDAGQRRGGATPELVTATAAPALHRDAQRRVVPVRIAVRGRQSRRRRARQRRPGSG